jgi:hypothetical protein
MKTWNAHQPDLFPPSPPLELTPVQRRKTIALLQILVTEAFQQGVERPKAQEAGDDENRG